MPVRRRTVRLPVLFVAAGLVLLGCSGNETSTGQAEPDVAAMRVDLRKFAGDTLSFEEVRAVANGFPFEAEVEGQHSYVTFVSDPDMLDELAALSADTGPREKIARGDGVLYWQVPKSATLESTIGKTMGKKRYKSSTTTRNLRTLAKVLR